nr:diacylglycerol kinase family protein [Limosilactobacillus caecicola]
MDSQDRQTTKNHRLLQAMRHSVSGIWLVVSRERNMRYHIAASIIVIILGLWLKLLPWEWLWLFLAIFTVFSAEFMNTVVESFCDLIVGHQFNINVKKIKDVSAGTVMIAAIFAVIVGLIIFGPRLIAVLGG